jgi:MFS family permease
MAAYIGRNSYELVSGLFFSGWDNQGHFTTFANTYEVGSTTWPTVDGSVAWNQWYPSLHTTVWSLAQLASQSTTALLDRPGLLWPYIQWNSITFALCLAALAWVSGDLAARLGGRDRERWTRPLAAGAFALFGLLGSPAFLYNRGFTNFMMAITIVVCVAYLSARSWRSARILGWFLVPLGGLAVIGLWTPLALGIVPSAVIVAIALLRFRRWWGVGWIGGSVVLAGFMALTQTAAILGVEPGTSAGDLTADLGAVGTGMSPFNLGLALVSPLIVVLLAALLIRHRRWPMAVAVVGPVVGAAIIMLIFVSGADTAAISRLQSYYVLKPLNAMLIAVTPLIAAMVAVALVRALGGLDRASSVITVLMGAAVTMGLFGYVGVFTSFDAGFTAAPGVQAGADRTRGVNDPLVGSAIIRGRDAAVPYPDYTTMLWDGAGTLPNLWVSSLSGVMSKQQNTFYRNLPRFPYDAKTAEYVNLALNLDAKLRVAVLWFREPSKELLDLYVQQRGDDRVKLVKVPMPSSLLCPECSL